VTYAPQCRSYHSVTKQCLCRSSWTRATRPRAPRAPPDPPRSKPSRPTDWWKLNWWQAESSIFVSSARFCGGKTTKPKMRRRILRLSKKVTRILCRSTLYSYVCVCVSSVHFFHSQIGHQSISAKFLSDIVSCTFIVNVIWKCSNLATFGSIEKFNPFNRIFTTQFLCVLDLVF
jgi:hypothetical protein